MISQQDLKKFAVKPSGPGALPEGVRDMAFKISSSVKGAAKASKSKRWTFKTPPVEIPHPRHRWAQDFGELVMNQRSLVLMGGSPSALVVKALYAILPTARNHLLVEKFRIGVPFP